MQGGGEGECFGSFSTFIQCLKTEKKRKEDGKGEELKCLLLKKEIPDGMLYCQSKMKPTYCCFTPGLIM